MKKVLITKTVFIEKEVEISDSLYKKLEKEEVDIDKLEKYYKLGEIKTVRENSIIYVEDKEGNCLYEE